MEEFFENELARKFEEMIENNDEFYFDTEEYIEIIIYYLELGDYSYAEMAVNHALKIHPNSLEVKTKQLEVFLELERYTKAKELIDELHQSSLEDTDFLVCCAKYYSNLGNPKKSIEYCQKALEVNPNYGNAYLLIGKMYAATSKSVFPNDGVLARAAYNAAIDKFEKAKQVDPSVAEEANTLISSYRAHLPSTEEIFMHPDLEKGKPFTVGGWIGERTTIR